ncbi:hypothetical protein CROQUDRAFT_49227 [Cronartium quercuum f. sp. fusiforme G11]|uniref:RRM domain-containing protein n=1 Tax=Cronartium quercuum f. sp. fusiforme G11 TaxID=708437 RepID=A0A9P6T8I5_9BASI|nr:hypothetical protein CROQUDRAFT_49227 [Cronartium quercuum f. sp. fusiforme G11]
MSNTSDQRQYRLHISGLAPSVSAEDMANRFAAFGTVIAVDGIGKLDVNGHPLKYGFLELKTSQLKLNRCMNMLSGTTYKGDTMRIALAKPNYIERAALEREGDAKNDLPDLSEAEGESVPRNILNKRAYKSRKDVDGYEGEHWDLMTVKRFKKHDGISGWKKDPATSLPIFPLIARPARPLPRLPDDSNEKSITNTTPLTSKPPNRARRVRIDPVSYRLALNGRNTHLIGPRAISIELYRLGHRAAAKETKVKDIHRKIWECEDDDDGRVVWRLKHGDKVEVEERVKVHPHINARSSVTGTQNRFITNQASKPLTKVSLPSVPLSTHLHRAADQPNRPLRLTAERQSHLAILRGLEAHPTCPEHEPINTSSFFPITSKSEGRDEFEVVKAQSNSSLDVDTEREDSRSSISKFKTLMNVNLPTSPRNDVLRLKGGYAPPTKRKRKSRPSSQSLNEDSPSTEPFSITPQEGTTVNTLAEAVGSFSDACDSFNPDLVAERKTYMHMAQKIASLPHDPSEALEEVGQGSKDVVERQKIKEENRRMVMASDAEDESPIEVVPQSNISILEPFNAISQEIRQEQKFNSEVKVSSLSKMFQAKEPDQIGFTLQDALAGVELEMEDPIAFMDVPQLVLPDSSRRTDLMTRDTNRADCSIHPSRLALTQSTSNPLGINETGQTRKHLFFALPVDPNHDLGIPASAFDLIRQQSALDCKFSMGSQGVLGEWRSFVRTESMSEIEERHDTTKAELTEQMRRKHKDAVKWAKKWGKK